FIIGTTVRKSRPSIPTIQRTPCCSTVCSVLTTFRKSIGPPVTARRKNSPALILVSCSIPSAAKNQADGRRLPCRHPDGMMRGLHCASRTLFHHLFSAGLYGHQDIHPFEQVHQRKRDVFPARC